MEDRLRVLEIVLEPVVQENIVLLKRLNNIETDMENKLTETISAINAKFQAIGDYLLTLKGENKTSSCGKLSSDVHQFKTRILEIEARCSRVEMAQGQLHQSLSSQIGMVQNLIGSQGPPVPQDGPGRTEFEERARELLNDLCDENPPRPKIWDEVAEISVLLGFVAGQNLTGVLDILFCCSDEWIETEVKPPFDEFSDLLHNTLGENLDRTGRHAMRKGLT